MKLRDESLGSAHPRNLASVHHIKNFFAHQRLIRLLPIDMTERFHHADSTDSLIREECGLTAMLIGAGPVGAPFYVPAVEISTMVNSHHGPARFFLLSIHPDVSSHSQYRAASHLFPSIVIHKRKLFRFPSAWWSNERRVVRTPFADLTAPYPSTGHKSVQYLLCSSHFPLKLFITIRNFFHLHNIYLYHWLI